MRGGKRKGAGRPKGSPNKRTLQMRKRLKEAVATALTSGILPLDVILAQMRSEPLPNGQYVTPEQFEAACAAAPFIHPKLSAMAVSTDKSTQLADRLAAALARTQPGRVLTIEPSDIQSGATLENPPISERESICGPVADRLGSPEDV